MLCSGEKIWLQFFYISAVNTFNFELKTLLIIHHLITYCKTDLKNNTFYSWSTCLRNRSKLLSLSKLQRFENECKQAPVSHYSLLLVFQSLLSFCLQFLQIPLEVSNITEKFYLVPMKLWIRLLAARFLLSFSLSPRSSGTLRNILLDAKEW